MNSDRYKWELIGWLWCAFFLNQADRQVYSVVLPQLRSELGLSDVQAGLVASVFSLSLGVCVPLAGWAGDRWDRRRIVVASLAAWSFCTLLTGFASGIIFLVAIRSVATGAGEAFYAPAAYALMAAHHSDTRSRAMSIHQTALYVGVVSCGALAGGIADQFGWRSSFYVFGIAGLLIAALVALRLKPAPPTRKQGGPPAAEVVKRLVSIPTALAVSAAFGCMVFVNVGYLTWMPTYLHERFGLSLGSAGFASMFWHHLFAFAGVTAGAWLADRAAAEAPWRRLEVQACGLMLGAPFLFLLGSLDTLTAVLAALSGFGFFRGVYDSNTYASLFEVVESHLHASASGFMIAVAFLFGSLAPLSLGVLKQSVGLAAGFGVLGLVYVLGALLLSFARWLTFTRDYRRAHAPASLKEVIA